MDGKSPVNWYVRVKYYFKKQGGIIIIPRWTENGQPEASMVKTSYARILLYFLCFSVQWLPHAVTILYPQTQRNKIYITLESRSYIERLPIKKWLHTFTPLTFLTSKPQISLSLREAPFLCACKHARDTNTASAFAGTLCHDIFFLLLK